MERDYVVNMAERNKYIKLMGHPCGMMDGHKIWPTVQYGWSGCLVNMPIHKMGDSCDGTQVEVDFKKWPKNSMGEIETRILSKYRG